MAKEKKIGSTKRFGPRYGRRVKKRFGTIEAEQRKLHKCPYCNAVKVKRESVGIWNCKKCGAKFTGKAYTISKKIIKEDIEEEPIEEIQEEQEEEFEEEAEDDDSEESVEETDEPNDQEEPTEEVEQSEAEKEDKKD